MEMGSGLLLAEPAARGAPVAPACCPKVLVEVGDPSPHQQLCQNIPRDTHPPQRAENLGMCRGGRQEGQAG